MADMNNLLLNEASVRSHKKEKALEDQHRALDHHWRHLPLDPRQSDHLFKHHISRLRHIYKHHASPDIHVGTNTAMEDRAKLHMSAVARLYGTDGMRTKGSSEKEALKELGWDDDVHNPSQRNPMAHKVKSLMAKSRFNSSTSSQSMDSSGNYMNTVQQPVPKKKTLRKFRCTDYTIMDEDVIVLGKYRLNEDQTFLYETFVSMLRSMDHFDAVNVLGDVLSDLKEHNSLDDYGGTDAK